jgi:hypothetical protein
MSSLGKILLFLNLVAAIAIFALIPMGYAKQRSWTYANYLWDLRLEGLPVDTDEKGPDGNPKVEKCTKGVVKDLGLDGSFQTQREFVDRAKNQLQTKIDNTEGGRTKEQNLARILLPFAKTYSEREAYLLTIEGKKPADVTEETLLKELDRLFEETRGANRSVAARKLAIANLLFGLADILAEEPGAGEGQGSPDVFASNPYKQFLQVVGLSAAVRAVDAQSQQLDLLAHQANDLLDKERARYVDQHARLVYEAQALADILQREMETLDNVSRETATAKAARDKRKTEVDELKKEYDQLRKDVQDRLTEQAAREQEIFGRLKALRETSRRNQELEKEIRKLEGEER